MSKLLSVLYTVYRIYFLLIFTFILLLFYPFLRFLFSKEKYHSMAFKVERMFTLVWHICVFIPIRVKGKENIPNDSAFVICPNHTSFMDIPCVYRIFDKYFVFIGKKEILKWPLFNVFFFGGKNITIDRESRRDAILAFRKMSDEIDKGHSLAIFPEGTISKKVPVMGDFKPGAFAIAIKKQVPIIPVTYLNNFKRLKSGGFLSGMSSPGFCDVIIHPPVYTQGLTKDDQDDLAKRVKEIIDKPLKEKYTL